MNSSNTEYLIPIYLKSIYNNASYGTDVYRTIASLPHVHVIDVESHS